MHPFVRDVYRRLLHAGREYPGGLAAIRPRLKAAFAQQAALRSEDDIAHAVARGRWWAKELVATAQLRKYRAMRARYGVGACTGRSLAQLPARTLARSLARARGPLSALGTSSARAAPSTPCAASESDGVTESTLPDLPGGDR
jgi:hypothetical protein